MMKLLFPALSFLFIVLQAGAQGTTTFQEDFEAYQGFGSSLINGWGSSPAGFKVYLRTIAGANNKICETALTNNHRKDSLITPELTLVTGSAILNFQSRIVDSYTGNAAFFSHIPVSGDELKAYLSVDGTAFTQVEDLLPSYPVTSAGLAMTNFSIPINGTSGSNAKVKFVANAKPGTEWYPSFDNFSLVHNSDPTASRKMKSSGNGIMLIPNPASHRISILSPGYGQQALVEIFNILGNLVFSAAMNNGKCVADVSNFRPGVYLVKVSEGNRFSMERLIVKQ
jgi:hypothetical protein